MGEGAGSLVLEEYEAAKKRGARIYGEIKGYGLTSDAYHVTLPSGDGARRCIEMALQNSGLTAPDVGYVNAHATSTPLGDPVEIEALASVFGVEQITNQDQFAVSATKGATGHMLGAAGAVEAAFALLALYKGILPPTLNFQSHDPDASTVMQQVNIVPNTAQAAPHLQASLTTSYGFGGTNAALLFGKL
jgi:3-oxoacyl-[acyl-carrier-protein] synthase II